MEWLVLIVIVVFIWLTVKASRADRVAARAIERVQELQGRLDRLERERPSAPVEVDRLAARAMERVQELQARLDRLERERNSAPAEQSAPVPQWKPAAPAFRPHPVPPVTDRAEVTPSAEDSTATAPVQPTSPESVTPVSEVSAAAKRAPVPPVEIVTQLSELPVVEPVVAKSLVGGLIEEPVVPPPIIPPQPVPRPEPPKQSPLPAINWEQFMGVKMFAWLGGLILFLGVAFFVKYSFDNNLVPPEVRVAIGYVLGLGLLVGGLWLARKDYRVLGQTLCATGVVVLYANVFGSTALYHLIGPMPAFGLMTLVTATAFVLAVQMDAQVVAVLGLFGGFLTPMLLSTGQDNPLGLFGYLTMLDAGLIAVALRKRWGYLVSLGAVGTVIMQIGWALKFFAPEKIYIALAVFIGFEALFLAAFLVARRRGITDQWLGVAGVVLGIAPFWFVWQQLSGSSLAGQTWQIFALVLAADLGLVWLVRQTQWNRLLIVIVLGTALAQFIWLTHHFTANSWPTALWLALGFEALFGGVLFRVRRNSAAGESAGDWFAGAAAAMAAMPFWFAVYLLNQKMAGQRLEIYFAFVLAGVVGFLLLAVRTRWTWLAPVAMGTTALLGALWVDEFFTVGKTVGTMGVALGFTLLFLGAWQLAERWKRSDSRIVGAAVAMAFVPLAFALDLLGYRSVAADQPALFFGYLLVADLVFVVLVLRRVTLARMQLLAGGVVFLVLAIWTGKYISESLLEWALGVNLFFATLHAVFPVVLKRRSPAALSSGWWQLFPLVSLALVTFPILRMPTVSWVVWLAVLLLDGVIFLMALLATAVFAMIGAIVFTMALAALWVFRVPVAAPPVLGLVWVIGGFALFFFGVTWFVARQAKKSTGRPFEVPAGWGLPAGWTIPGQFESQLPALGAILPFTLLMMVLARLTLASPAPVFGLALLLVVLLLGVVRATKTDWLAAVAFVCTGLLEWIWLTRFDQSSADLAAVTVYWNLIFYAAFTLFPFVFRKQLLDRVLPWAVAALAGPVHLWLMFGPIKTAWPGLVPMLGLVPAVLSVPALVGLIVLVRSVPAELPTRNTLLAWFGGVALFFLTVVFPIQLDRQWLTVSWALEGMALLWLLHRVPHPGLKWVGTGLLITAFVRLAVNPAVLEYHVRGATPIFNWYLYTYGITTICLFGSARLLAPPRQTVFGVNAQAGLATLGTVLAFLLLNIEIADFFTKPGTTSLTLEFSGDFTRDMTYSIAWALFALVLLVFGIGKKLAAVRYASLALIGITLLKLFFHDLSQLGQLQRIGAFVGVAVILLVASFLYQRFVAAEEKSKS